MSKRDQNHTDPVSGVHERAKALEAHILEHSRDAEAGETVAGGYTARGAAKPEDSEKNSTKRKSGDMMQAVLDSTAEMQRQLERLYEQREALYDQLSDLEFKIDKLDQTIQQMHQGNIPEIGPDGALVDTELEAMVAVEEKRLGRSIDRSDPQALMAIFAAEQERSTSERDDVLEAINKNEAEIEALQEGRSLDEAPQNSLSASTNLKQADNTADASSDQVAVNAHLDQFTF